MNKEISKYKEIDLEKYYRRDVYRHFSEDCKCSVSITSRVDVTSLVCLSKKTGTKFYINFLNILSRALNSRADYRMQFLFPENKLVEFETINPAHYVFHDDTETCTVVYSRYYEDYDRFYNECEKDISDAKSTRAYGLDAANHPNWFDASYVSWLSYDSLNVELPDGYLHFMPVVNWGRYREERGRLMMPVSVRLNHAAADGYLVGRVFSLLEKGIADFCREHEKIGASDSRTAGESKSSENEKSVEIETERLILRRWRDSDAPELYKYAKDPAVGPIAGWPVHTSVENSLEIIRGVLSAPETYAVVLKSTGKPVGSVGIMFNGSGSAPIGVTEAEIGYWIGVPYWGNGYIPEAVRALLERCFTELSRSAVWCGYYDGNDKSRRVQEKCGFIYHHTETDKPCPLGDARTEHFTLITKKQFEDGKRGESGII